MQIIQWEGERKVHFYFHYPYCNCEWLAEKAEVEITYSYQNCSPLFFMDCPNCGVTTPCHTY